MAASSRLNLPAWQALEQHREQLGAHKVRDMFAADPRRFVSLSREAIDLLFDFSRQRLQPETIALLIQLARECELEMRIVALLAGEPVNNTEGRPALHTALRRSLDQSLFVNGHDVMRDVKVEREKVFGFVRDVYEGRVTGHTGKKFEAVINIGIGGSDLGPMMAVEALARFRARGLEMHFVSNVDGCQLADAIASANPETTLVVICSKTLTTLETMSNAQLARRWIVERLGAAALPKHFAAVSVNQRAMDEFGIGPALRFTMWDWVGGRYSLWSSIGVSLALAIGTENFQAFLDGGRMMDEHFASTPLERNLAVLLGLIGVWNRNFLAIPSHAVLPYDRAIASLAGLLATARDGEQWQARDARRARR